MELNGELFVVAHVGFSKALTFPVDTVEVGEY
jgi:hypothetical protein